MTDLSPISIFLITSQCRKLVNKISQEPLEPGSWYLDHRLCLKCRWPDQLLVKFSQSITELSPFSVFLIITQWNLVNKISQEPLQLGSWNLYHRLCLKCKWPDQLLVKFSQFITELSPFSVFLIITQWNLVNKISQEPLQLGSWNLYHRLCLKYRWPDQLLVKFSQSIAELSPFSVFLIIAQWNLVNKISEEPLQLGSWNLYSQIVSKM